MPTKPTVKPRWAEDDVTDPASGQPNVSEPPSSRKDSGWNRREIPPRQWFNWLHRFYYRWIDWLDGTTIPLTLSGSTTNEQKTDGTGHTHSITTSDATGSTATNVIASSKAVKDAKDEAIASAGQNVATRLGNLTSVWTGSSTSIDFDDDIAGGHPGAGLYLVTYTIGGGSKNYSILLQPGIETELAVSARRESGAFTGISHAVAIYNSGNSLSMNRVKVEDSSAVTTVDADFYTITKIERVG